MMSRTDHGGVGRNGAWVLWAGLMVLISLGVTAQASDWPQFMRDAAHTGDAADETLTLPLALVAQVKLDDVVMTSPAVVGGLAYVVDQMGTAYCIDPRAGRIVPRGTSFSPPLGELKMVGERVSALCGPNVPRGTL